MNEKTLSNPIKNLIQEKPRDIFSSLSNAAYGVLGVLLDGAADLRTIFFDQETIARRSGYSTRTVSSGVKELRDMGLISTKQRYNKSLIYNLSILFQRPDWHAELWHWFKRFPALSLSISMLIGGSEAKLRPSINIKKERSFLSLSYDGYPIGEQVVSEANHNVVRGICLALNKRGAFLTNDECLNLFAFPKEILDKVCLEMKTATSVKYPAAFFFGQCRKYAVESRICPDWSKIQILRDRGYIVLSEGEESRNIKQEEVRKEYPKEQYAKTQYAVQVKHGMQEEKAKAEARKPKVLALEEEIASWERTIAEYKANPKNIPSSLNEIMLKMAENKLQALREEHQNSTGSQVSPFGDGLNRDRSQNVNPVADLLVSAKKGDGVEKDLFDSGQRGSDVKTSYVQGSIV